MNREQIINDMCMTFRHDYGLEISEEDKMYTLMSGMTRREREALYNDMAQVYDNNIAPLLEDCRKVNDGEAVTLSKSKEHAKLMMGIAQFYLDHNT